MRQIVALLAVGAWIVFAVAYFLFPTQFGTISVRVHHADSAHDPAENITILRQTIDRLQQRLNQLTIEKTTKPAPKYPGNDTHGIVEYGKPPNTLSRVDGARVNVFAPGTIPRPWSESVFVEGDLTVMHSGAAGNHFCADYPKRPHVIIELPEFPEKPSMKYSTRPLRTSPRDESKSVTIFQVGEPLVREYVQFEVLSGSQDNRFEVKCPIVCKYTNVADDLPNVDAVLHSELPDLRWMTEQYWGHPRRLQIVWANENPRKTLNFMGNHEIMRRFDMTWHWHRKASVLGPSHDDKFYTHDSHLSDEPNFAPMFCSPGPKRRDSLAVTVVWNCDSGNKRQETIDALKAFGLTVSEYGGCRGSPSTDGASTNFNLFYHKYNTKTQVLSEHKFTLAFENDNSPDWVSEKVFHAFAASSIPVYLGSPSIDEFVPPHSIINVRDWPDLQHLVAYLQYLDRNETAYNEYLAWKKTNTWTVKSYVATSSKRYQACGGCLAVYDERERLKAANLWDKSMPWERRGTFQVLTTEEGLVEVPYT